MYCNIRFQNHVVTNYNVKPIRMVGGKGESYANIGEGLATGLQCFEDLQLKREPNTASQKHCILICNSPPYQIMIQECYKFTGHTIEQLATIYQEVNNINVVYQEIAMSK